MGHGQRLALLGPNGSGKTTLARIVAGLMRPVQGSSRLLRDGLPLDGAARRLALGFVTPDLALDGDLTALENLRFHGRMRGLAPGGEAALLERVGLAGRSDDRVGSYSSGMRQRLKYAFAIQAAPALLIVDEPTANLDEAGAVLVNEILDEQRQRGILVVATNVPSEAAGADYTIRLGD